MDKERFLSSGLLEQYVLGLTDPEETEEVERHIRRFPELKEELDGMRRAIEQYALQHSIPPPPHLKKNILEEIDRGAPAAAAGSRPKPLAAGVSWPLLFTGLLAIGFGLLSAFLFRQNHASTNQLQALQAEHALFVEQCEKKDQQRASLDRLNLFLTHQSTQPVELKGTPLSPESKAMVYWNPQEKKAYFNNLSLPEPPEGKQYQIWADVEGKMIDMGLLDSDQAALQAIGYIDGAESLNITLEPAGGSEHPTVSQLFANGLI